MGGSAVELGWHARVEEGVWKACTQARAEVTVGCATFQPAHGKVSGPGRIHSSTKQLDLLSLSLMGMH